MKLSGFLKKEMYEIIKTPKWLILPAVFLFFGIMSPLTARYINEILDTMGGGLDLQLPEPTYFDSYAQFFKNLNSMCILVVILTIMGTVVDEKVKGSAILVLTKNVSRFQFIISKFVSAVILFTFAFTLSSAACVYYTYALFDKFYNVNLWLSLFVFWVFGVFIISLTVLASTVAKSHTLAAVIGFAGYALASASGMAPYVNEYTPGALNGLVMKILQGSCEAAQAVAPIAVTVLLGAIVLGISVSIFKRQEL